LKRQTNDLATERKTGKGLRVIGMPLSLLFIPVLAIAAGISIPVAIVASRVMRRREKAFRRHMQACGRVMEWADFIRAVDESRGTLIEERYSLKGPVRWWWTLENVYEVCPHAIVDWLTMLHEPSFRPVSEWFRERYTSPDQGKAFLVSLENRPRGEAEDLRSRLHSESGTVRWIEVVPPESLRNRSAR
jgi:hypothetical protein